MDTQTSNSRLRKHLFNDSPLRVNASENLSVIVAILFERRAPPDAISAFKAALTDCPLVLRSAEVSGSFDFIIEAVFPDMAAYNDQLHFLADRLATLVARYETSFVGRRFTRARKLDWGIWVPLDNGFKRIDCSMIDKVLAEGDYMRIHSGDMSWMLHTTLHALVERLPVGAFVQISRSAVVRHGFIDSVSRTGRKWFALLEDGTREPITKSRAVEILPKLRSASSKPQHFSSESGDFTDPKPSVNENLMR